MSQVEGQSRPHDQDAPARRGSSAGWRGASGRARARFKPSALGRALARVGWRSVGARLIRGLARFAGHSRGTVAVTFALTLIPLLIAVGASFDFVHAYIVHAEMQSNLDAALLSVAKNLDSDDNAALISQVNVWFASQTSLAAGRYTIKDIQIAKDKASLSATVATKVDTIFMRIVGVNDLDVTVYSRAEGAKKLYQNVYVVLDKSASMLLAATPADQAALNAKAGCVFACHTSDGGSWTYGARQYTNVYDLSVAMGVKLRADVTVDAVSEVLSVVEASDPKRARIKLGLYTLGTGATQVLAPTFSTTAARARLRDPSSGLTSHTSEPATYFDYALPTLARLVGRGGDGSSANKPRKLVLIATDGVQSQREWVLSTSAGARSPTSSGLLPTLVTPLNPQWCKALKDNNITIGVLYTEYLPTTWDWGYNATLGKTMASSGFASTWGGMIASGQQGKTRQAYIPIALQQCASSQDMFLHADSPTEISAGLSAILKKYLNTTRLAA